MYLTETTVVYLPKNEDRSTDYEKLVQDLELESERIYESFPVTGEKKRMRLHQLTWEEKIQRKKLRNRIAAQTSRDRKKAKMDYLEESVKDLKYQNELLFMQVEELRKQNEVLVVTNSELQKALAERSYTCSCVQKIKENAKVVPQSDKLKEQICVKDGNSFKRPAESSEIPQQKGQWSTSAQVLADFKGESFFDDLERLAASLLEEVEQHESRRDSEISAAGRQKCIYSTEVVGETPEKLESTGAEVTSTCQLQKQCSQSSELTVEEMMQHISEEHSYAVSAGSNFYKSQFVQSNPQCEIPTILISEAEKISAIENELKNGLEFKEAVPIESDTLDIFSTFPNTCSPRSEVLSDQGYDSVGSPNESVMSLTDSTNEFDGMWENSFLELFPELL